MSTLCGAKLRLLSNKIKAYLIKNIYLYGGINLCLATIQAFHPFLCIRLEFMKITFMRGMNNK